MVISSYTIIIYAVGDVVTTSDSVMGLPGSHVLYNNNKEINKCIFPVWYAIWNLFLNPLKNSCA